MARGGGGEKQRTPFGSMGNRRHVLFHVERSGLAAHQAVDTRERGVSPLDDPIPTSLSTQHVRDTPEAEDAVHDAVITAWRKWASLRDRIVVSGGVGLSLSSRWDAARFESGVRKGVTTGNPVTLRVRNKASNLSKLPPVERPRPRGRDGGPDRHAGGVGPDPGGEDLFDGL